MYKFLQLTAANPANHSEGCWRVIDDNSFIIETIVKNSQFENNQISIDRVTLYFPITSQIKFKFPNINRNVFRTHSITGSSIEEFFQKILETYENSKSEVF